MALIGFDTTTGVENEFGDKFGDNYTKNAIMDLMREEPTISARTISEVIGLSSRGVEKSISELKRDGFIERVGSAKGGHWMVSTTPAIVLIAGVSQLNQPN